MSSTSLIVAALMMGVAAPVSCGGKTEDTATGADTDASVDACILATADAVCCENARSASRPATTCGGSVECAVVSWCVGGRWYEDHDDCHFKTCPGVDSGGMSDAATDGTAAADADALDACVHATESATCCEGSEFGEPRTICGGTRTCTFWHYCRFGHLVDDYDDCFFKECRDSGLPLDADADE